MSASGRMPASTSTRIGCSLTLAEAPADRRARHFALEQQLRRLGRASADPGGGLAARIAGLAAERPQPAVATGTTAAGRVSLVAAIMVVLVPIAWLTAVSGAGGWIPFAATLVVASMTAGVAWGRSWPDPRGLVIMAVIAALGLFARQVSAAALPLLGGVVDCAAMTLVTAALLGGGWAACHWARQGWQPGERLRHPVECLLIAGYLLALGLILMEPSLAS